MPRVDRAFDIAGRVFAGSIAVGLLVFGVAHFPATDAVFQIQHHEQPATPPTPARVVQATPITVALPPPLPSAAVELDGTIKRLGKTFPGDVGIAVHDVQTGWSSHYRGLDYFPQQSVSKLWVALSLFDQVDRGAASLGQEITVRPEDLTLFHQPLRTLALRPGGFHTTAHDLVVRALTQSDNSANDRLLKYVGGPASIRTTLAQKGVAGVRFGPGEPLLQSQIAGLEWAPEFRVGTRFQEARQALPTAVRRTAFDAYTANPIDGATPLGIAGALARLQQGHLLSAASTDQMLSIMGRTRTGAMRLKGGLHDGWTLSHKTGTGQVFAGEQAGYNDVGILTSPGGQAYAVAVLIGRTSQPLPTRMRLMHRVVEATIAYDAQLAAQRAAAGPAILADAHDS